MERKYRPVEDIPNNFKKPCKCGCGEMIWHWDKFHEIRHYILGHHQKFMVQRKGEESPHWSGGRFIDKNGYVYVYSPDHPFAKNYGYVFEHRLVWEQCNNACLLPWIAIHHKNGMRDDNRIENLEPITHSEHALLHNSIRY
jgi:hypothetical protein